MSDEFGLKDVTAEMIKIVRNETRAGTIDCRDALIESKGDTDKAIQIIKDKGVGTPKKVWVQFNSLLQGVYFLIQDNFI